MPLIGEEWRPTLRSADYEVSNKGRVRSYRGQGSRTDLGRRLDRPILLSPVTYRGYRLARINRRMVKVGILVLEAFVGQCPEEMECCHGPNGKLDDSLDNLRWGTHQSNMDDKTRDGTNRPGEECHLSKLTEETALIALDMRAQGMTCKAIADELGVSLGTIWHLVKGKTWKHLPRERESIRPHRVYRRSFSSEDTEGQNWHRKNFMRGESS